jgi:hypothetical protein
MRILPFWCVRKRHYIDTSRSPSEVHLRLRAPADGLGKDATSLHILPQLNFRYSEPQGRPPSSPRLTLDLQWVILASCQGEAIQSLCQTQLKASAYCCDVGPLQVSPTFYLIECCFSVRPHAFLLAESTGPRLVIVTWSLTRPRSADH